MLRDDGQFHISSFCTAGSCVAVAFENDGVLVTDRSNPDRDPLRFGLAEWAAFVAGVRNGEFDLP